MWWHTRRNHISFSAKQTSTFKKGGGGGALRSTTGSEVCASAVVMLDTPCSEVVWRILATHFIRQFPLRFPSRASQCAITFQLDPTCLQSVFARLLKLLHSWKVKSRNGLFLITGQAGHCGAVASNGPIVYPQYADHLIYLFIYCNWVVTRWQWLFYM